MALFVHNLPFSGSYMLRNAQTLERVFLLLPVSSEFDFYVDRDRATVDPNHTPLFLRTNSGSVSDLWVNIELGIKFPAGTVFYAEGFAAGNVCTLVFS